MRAERILRAPDVTGNDIGVRQVLRHQGERIQVVPERVIPVHDQFYAEFIDQVFKFLFHEADYNVDLANSRFMELPDLPLDQRLTGDLKERFRRLQVDRHHAHAKSCRQNDRPAWLRVPAQFLRLRRETHRAVKVALTGQDFQRSVDHTEGVPRPLRQRTLVCDRGLQQHFHNIAFLYVHEHLHFTVW